MGRKKLTTEEFVIKSNERHGGRYDYSKTEYIDNKTPVVIICPDHGEFRQMPSEHLRGCGCPECGNFNRGSKKRMTTEEFIERSVEKHGNKYGYGNVRYVNSITPVSITCPNHGDFLQLPPAHLRGQGCPKCSGKGITNEELIKRFREIHGERYDYSKVKFTKMDDKVTIICRDHGEFEQTPSKHLSGQGCPKCSKTKRSETDDFIKKAEIIHQGKYGYKKVKYINNKTKVTINCPCHGDFEQTPHNHLKGQGCPKCALSKYKQPKYNTETFIEKCKEIHGDEYIYDSVKYTNMKNKVTITCKKHGDFYQMPYLHLNGSKCPKCVSEKNADNRRLTLKEFVEKSKQTHGEKYCYSLVNYTTARNKVIITCPIHGNFVQEPWHHISGNGCPKCKEPYSKPELEIYNILCSKLGCENVEQHNRTILNGKEIDIYIPSRKIGIEYNGLLWHSQLHQKDRNYHLNKLVECNRQGIKLIQVFEDEYVRNKELVITKILHILGISDNLPKIGARKCLIRNITKKQCESFMNSNHIQGFSSGSVYIGAFFNDQLIGSMIFRRISGDSWELVRFATHNGYICQGLGGKLFKYFVKTYNPKTVKSFADRRWTADQYDNIYTKLGFSLEKTLKPEYRYYRPSDGPVRHHKFAFRKNILHRKYGLPLSLSETQMTEQLGYTKVFDCGMFKYVWKNELN